MYKYIARKLKDIFMIMLYSKNYEIVKEKIDNNMLDEYEFENIPTKENGNKLFISGV